jgi:hypothetical protein
MALKKSKKTVEEPMAERSALTNILFAITALFATYILALWAIDSGSLLVYALTFGSLYTSVHFMKLFIRLKFFNNDKTAKARSSKR